MSSSFIRMLLSALFLSSTDAFTLGHVAPRILAYRSQTGGQTAHQAAHVIMQVDETDVAESADLSLEMEANEDGSDEDTMKEVLKAEIADGMSGPTPDKAMISEVILALEGQNPTKSPATSELLNGKWKLLYATGASPGRKALEALLKSMRFAPKSPSGAGMIDIQDTYLTITEEQPRATASTVVRLLSNENTLKLSSNLEAESAVRLTETYASAEATALSLKLPFQSPVEYKRSIIISYLDEEMLIIRDVFGRPDVLMRVDTPITAAEEELTVSEDDTFNEEGSSDEPSDVDS